MLNEKIENRKSRFYLAKDKIQNAWLSIRQLEEDLGVRKLFLANFLNSKFTSNPRTTSKVNFILSLFK